MSRRADFVDARLCYIHELRAEGRSWVDIAKTLNVDVVQVQLIFMEPVDPPVPGSLRARLKGKGAS